MIQKIFRTTLILVTALIAAVLIGGFMTSSEWRSEASNSIQAPVTQVFEQVDTPRNWPNWTPWNSETYPELSISYSGAESGVGARYQWFDGAMNGELYITQSVPNQTVQYTVVMDDGEFEMDCGFDFVDGQQVEVTWGCSGDSGANPVQRLMMKLYEPMMRRDFELGLQQLKAHFEG